jgi:hypothetical protein
MQRKFIEKRWKYDEGHEKSMESGNKLCLRGKTFPGVPLPAPRSNIAKNEVGT